MQESKAKSSQLGDMALESTQSGFIQKLLKECKTKVDFIIWLFDLSFNGWCHESYQNVISPREWKKGQDPTTVKVKPN